MNVLSLIFIYICMDESSKFQSLFRGKKKKKNDSIMTNFYYRILNQNDTLMLTKILKANKNFDKLTVNGRILFPKISIIFNPSFQ